MRASYFFAASIWQTEGAVRNDYEPVAGAKRDRERGTKYFLFVCAHTNMQSLLIHDALVHQYIVLFRHLHFSIDKSFEHSFIWC